MALFRRNPLKAETAVNYLEAKAVIDELAEQVLDRHNGIIGIAVGRKDRGPVAGAHDFSVTAFVEEKLSQEQLQTRDIEGFDRVAMHAVARQTGRPLTRGDIDVVETAGPMRPIAGLSVPAAQRGTHQGNPPALNAQKWFHSLRIGVGITNPQGEYPHSHSVGSIGFFLRDIDGNTYLVSNNHVIGRLGLAKSPEPIVHPGTIDLSGSDLLNCPDLPTLFARFQVAEFTACVPIHFKSATNIPVNWVDAGMAKLTESGRRRSELSALAYGGNLLDQSRAFIPDDKGAIAGCKRVYKVGRTTGYTEGVVTAIAGAFTIRYGPQQEAHFRDQIVVAATADNVGPFSAPGDSGSGLLTERHELVGLVFGGNDTQTLANPISNVINELRTASGIQSLELIV